MVDKREDNAICFVLLFNHIRFLYRKNFRCVLLVCDLSSIYESDRGQYIPVEQVARCVKGEGGGGYSVECSAAMSR